MTRAAHRPTSPRRPTARPRGAVSVAVPASIGPALACRWSISPHAAHAAGLLAGAPTASTEVLLEIRVQPTGPASAKVTSALLIDGERSAPLGEAIATLLSDGPALRHADADGLLHLTYSTSPTLRPLYARTSLLEALRIPGGRAELVSLTPVEL